jgi:hypothetical protein
VLMRLLGLVHWERWGHRLGGGGERIGNVVGKSEDRGVWVGDVGGGIRDLGGSHGEFDGFSASILE